MRRKPIHHCTATSPSSTAKLASTKDVTVSRSLLEQYKREHTKYLEEIEKFCTSKAVPYFRTHTKIPFDELVLKIFRAGGFLR